jgi:hypothetical protein
MITVAQVVEEIIRKSPFLESALAEEIINLSSLARKIKPQIEEALMKNVQEGAIIMALKRFDKRTKDVESNVKEVMKKISDLSVRSKLIEFTFLNSSTLIMKIEKVLELIKNNKDHYLTISQGIFETTIIVNADLENEIVRVFKNEKMIAKLDRLSSITVKLPPENVEVTGIYYTLLKALAWENINLVDAVSTTNEVTIVFKERDIDRAFSVLKNISE